MIDEPGSSRTGASPVPGARSDDPTSDASVSPEAGIPAAGQVSPDLPRPVAAEPDAPRPVAGTPPPDAPRPATGVQPPDPPLDLDRATEQALRVMPGRSDDPTVCPFLRGGAAGDLPPESVQSGHRCVAVTPALTVTERQRRLVCQGTGHASCPRHVRGEAAVRASLAPGIGRRSRAAPAAIGTAAVLLIVTAAVAATSGVATPGGGAEATAAAGGPEATPSQDAQGPSGPTAEPDASGRPAATLAPLATVRPTLVATRDLPAAWRKLEACPAPDTCYLYVVKRGDTLGAIAGRFDTTVKKLKKLNPTLGDANAIRVGRTIRVPPPPS